MQLLMMNSSTPSSAQRRRNRPEVDFSQFSPKEKACVVVIGFLMFFVTICFVFLIMPFSPPNPNPNRTVHLNKIDGSYGFDLRWNIIVEITAGGSADLSAEIKMDDEVLSMNGVRIGGLRPDQIDAILKMTDTVDLVVIAKHQVSLVHRLLFNLAFAFILSLITSACMGAILCCK